MPTPLIRRCRGNGWRSALRAIGGPYSTRPSTKTTSWPSVRPSACIARSIRSDKDGIVSALLAAEITARLGRDPGEIYLELARELGAPVYDRIEAPATPEQQELLGRLSPQQVRPTDLAGEVVESIITHAPGNGAPIGGLKVIAKSGWFAARPSGTEGIYEIRPL